MLTKFWRAQFQTALLYGKRRGKQMQEMMLSTPAKAFAGNMPAELSGLLPGDMAVRPQIPATCRVLPPAIPGNNLNIPAVSQSGRPSLADVLDGMGGVLPECMANMPSTLR